MHVVQPLLDAVNPAGWVAVPGPATAPARSNLPSVMRRVSSGCATIPETLAGSSA